MVRRVPCVGSDRDEIASNYVENVNSDTSPVMASTNRENKTSKQVTWVDIVRGSERVERAHSLETIPV